VILRSGAFTAVDSVALLLDGSPSVVSDPVVAVRSMLPAVEGAVLSIFSVLAVLPGKSEGI
jgi:hypothetical protein